MPLHRIYYDMEETGMEIDYEVRDPSMTAGQVLPKGRAVTFWWTASGMSAGNFEGTVWLRLRFKPHADGDEETTTLAAPRINIEERQLIFLSGPAARVLGGFLLVSSVLLTIFYWRKI